MGAGRAAARKRAMSGAVVTRPAAACSAKAKSGTGPPSASCGRAVSAARDHRKALAVMPSGSSTSARMWSASGRPVSSSTSSWSTL